MTQYSLAGTSVSPGHDAMRALYRTLLRESRFLPDEHLTCYFREWARSTFRRLDESESAPESSVAAQRRIARAEKLARQLRAANDGYQHALQRAIELAYGIRGPQKHRRLQRLLPDSPRKAEWAFPPALAALVTSPIAHFSRAPLRSQLETPPTMPERADPSSEAARLLGPLPLQRKRAIKRRWYNLQIGKVHAPVIVDEGDNEQSGSLDVQALKRLEKLASGDFTETNVDERLAKLQARERRTTRPRSNSKWHNPKVYDKRFLARRYAEALSKLPVMQIGKRATVSRSPLAHGEPGRLSLANEEDVFWARRKD